MLRTRSTLPSSSEDRHTPQHSTASCCCPCCCCMDPEVATTWLKHVHTHSQSSWHRGDACGTTCYLCSIVFLSSPSNMCDFLLSRVSPPCRSFESWMSWGTNPLYALLHESIYCQGAASSWAAQRVREQHYQDAFDALAAANSGEHTRGEGGVEVALCRIWCSV